MLVAVRDNVARSKNKDDRGEAVAAKPTAAFDAKFGNFVIDPGFFTRLVYEGPRFLFSPMMGRNRYWTCARSPVPKLLRNLHSWPRTAQPWRK
jgi:hypothetical protein